MAESVVLLHGFSGTHRAWEEVVERLPSERYLALAPDLPGHGAAAAVRPISFDSCVAHVLERAPQRFLLCGYSMGGRIALHLALSAPERVSRLVLVSSTAGIADEGERAQRRAADRRLADELEALPYERFIERWRSQPLFAEDPPEVCARAAEDQRRNDPCDLAAVLRGVGSGEMQPLWGRLGELQMPALVLVGERDAKFLQLGRRLVERLPDGRLCVVSGGHGLPLENPASVASALTSH